MKFLDGFNDAIVGVGEQKGNEEPFLIYDYEKCVQILMEKNDWEREDAEEWMDYNVTDLYIGKDTPAFLYPAEINGVLFSNVTEGDVH